MTTEAERPVSREPRGRDNRRIRAVPGLVPHRHAKAVLEVALRVYVTGAECEPVRLGVADRGRGRRDRERQYEHGCQEKGMESAPRHARCTSIARQTQP